MPSIMSRIDWLCEEIKKEAAASEPSCQSCGKPIASIFDFYRCWDCKMGLCEICAPSHFGSQHQPHPVIVPQIREALASTMALAATVKDLTVDQQAAMYRAGIVLDRLPKPRD